jgi:hypothetical protein
MLFGFRVEEDCVGTDFHSIEDSIKAAGEAQRQIERDGDLNCRIEITDHDGRLLATVPRANN